MTEQAPQSRVRRRAAGLTLIELLIASATASILIGGLASSIFLASQSLDVHSGALTDTRKASEVLEVINRDLHSALTVTELTATAVTMTVPDRDGDSVAETIRYAWSGVAGDPLTCEYNGGSPEDLATRVQTFSLAWTTRFIEGVTSLPIILFVSSQSPGSEGGGLTTATSAEQYRVDLMESWGYDVTVISQDATSGQFDTQLAESTVVYVPDSVSNTALASKLNAAAVGVITESFSNAQTLGFYASPASSNSNQTTIEITNNTHYITENFSTGELTISNSDIAIKWTSATPANDAAVLANSSSGLPFPTLLILDAGDELADTSASAGRRCQLPWGESGFDVRELNSEGLMIMQRALEWGAGAGADTETVATGITFESFSEQQESSGTSSISIGLPAGLAEGDLLIAAVVTDDDESGSLSPSEAGWNQIYVLTDGGGDVTLGVWWRLATASEPSAYTFTWGSSEEAYGTIMRFTGHSPTNPIHAQATNDGSSSSPTAPAVTTTEDNCMIVRLGGFDDDDVNVDDAGMANHTTITCDYSGTGTGTCAGAATYQTLTAAGNAGSANFTLSGSEQYRTVTIALEPDTSP